MSSSIRTAVITTSKTSVSKKFGRYSVQKLLGEGAMGKVFLARDPVLNRQVAIKVISVDRQLDDTTRREYLSRFSVEARLSAQLNHPSIVPVYDAGEEDGIPWIAFQYIDGVTLDKIIKNKGKLSVKWALHVAMDIAAALQHAHEIHVVHRDIKPANIMIDRHGGTAKLTDFGVAKVPWASFTCEGNAMGSPGYMSPEQIEGRAFDERSDIFSLGVVLYEMVAGRHPFVRDTAEATAYAVIGGKYPRLGDTAKGVPAKFTELIASCLEADPEKRVPSATRLIALLRDAIPGDHRSIRAKTKIADETSAGRKRWGPIIARNRKKLNFLVIAVGVASAIVMVSVFSPGKHTWQITLPVNGLDDRGKRMVAGFRSWFDLNNLDSAQALADALTATDNGAVCGRFLQGIIACCKAKYDKAQVFFDQTSRLPGGKGLFEENRHFIAQWFVCSFNSKRSPDGLVTLLVKKFYLDEDPLIKGSLHERAYWSRWNAVRTLQVGGKKVDLVPVFIMDIRYADDEHVRVQAARDLGDLGDRRAVPALKEAYGRRTKDPLVSAEAGKVLKTVFKEKV